MQRPLKLSTEALFRHQVVSEVRAKVCSGMKVTAAVGEVAGRAHEDLRGGLRTVSERTVYRWLRAFEEAGAAGLEPGRRKRVESSLSLSPEMVRFLKAQKLEDPLASVPEVVNRAVAAGVVAAGSVSRTTAWRACVRMGLPLTRPQRQAERDMRRFTQPHRMMMALADGKHFRAGPTRQRRVAMTLLDDATRMGLALMVATTECTELFLHTFHEAVLHFGMMISLFVDNGPGFISDDTRTVLASLGVNLIHGRPGYPEGHGKIERFHRRMNAECLRALDGNPAVDPDPGALTVRLNHWLTEVYNREPHRGLDGDSPLVRFSADERDLVWPEEGWQRHFVVSADRKVSADNVISYDGTLYEVPLGSAGRYVEVSRHLLEGNALSVVHEGREVRLAPVNPTENARARRAKKVSKRTSDPACPRPTTTAAAARFEQTHEPLVGADGGYTGGDTHDDD